MKNYYTIYYLLVMLLILGAFASMAQNGYGIAIIGGAALTFGLIFLWQSVQKLKSEENTKARTVVELLSLFLLSILLAFRVFYIHFLFIEYLFGLAGLSLILVYFKKITDSYKSIRLLNGSAFLLSLLFFGSITFYLATLTVIPFIPWLAEAFGVVAFVMIISFGIIALMKRELMIEGNKISPFKFAFKTEERSVLLISVFLLFTLYTSLTRIDLMPEIYSDEFPQAYLELVDKAESGTEEPADGNYRHEKFKEAYDSVVEKYSDY
jgi:hypothetical protein